MLDASAQTDNLTLKPADKGSIRRSQIFFCKCSWPALHFSHIYTYSLQSMHVVVLKVFVVFVFKLNSIGTCQFRYPPNGQLSTIYAKAVLSGWLFWKYSQTELPDCTFRIIDLVYMVI